MGATRNIRVPAAFARFGYSIEHADPGLCLESTSARAICRRGRRPSVDALGRSSSGPLCELSRSCRTPGAPAEPGEVGRLGSWGAGLDRLLAQHSGPPPTREAEADAGSLVGAALEALLGPSTPRPARRNGGGARGGLLALAGW